MADYTAGGTADEILAQQWKFYQDYYLPTEKALTAEVLSGVPKEYSPDFAAAAMGDAFSKQEGIKARNQQRYGIPTPAMTVSGTVQPDEQQYAAELALIRKAAEAGARNDARKDWRDVNVSRLNAVTQIGMGIPAQAESAANTASAMQNSMKLNRQLATQGLVNMGIKTVGSAASYASGGSGFGGVKGEATGGGSYLMNSKMWGL